MVENNETKENSHEMNAIIVLAIAAKQLADENMRLKRTLLCCWICYFVMACCQLYNVHRAADKHAGVQQELEKCVARLNETTKGLCFRIS